MNINPIPHTPSYALTDKDRQMIDDLVVNAQLTDDVEDYDDLTAILSSGNSLINNSAPTSIDVGKLLDIRL